MTSSDLYISPLPSFLFLFSFIFVFSASSSTKFGVAIAVRPLAFVHPPSFVRLPSSYRRRLLVVVSFATYNEIFCQILFIIPLFFYHKVYNHY